MRRPLILSAIAATIILLPLALDTGAWWLLTTRLQTEAAAWQQARIDAGYAVTAGAPSRAGWPFHAELTLPDVGIATGTPNTANAVAWHTGEVRLVYAPWRPSEVTVVLGGVQTLQLGAAAPVMLQVQNLELVAPLDQSSQAGGFVATARHLQLPLPAGQFGADRVWLQLGPADIHVALSALTLPDPGSPLGVTVNSLDLQARSTIPLPDQRDPAAAAAAWRNAGGQLVIGAAALEWGPLTVHGTATFTLDRALQPAGNGTLHVTGYAQALDALAHSGLITRNNARVAGTLLGLMSHTATDGVAQADLPFTLQDGLLMTGAIPLAKIPSLSLP